MEEKIGNIIFRPIKAIDYDFLWRLHNASMKKYVTETWGWNEDWQKENFAKEFSIEKGVIIVLDNQDSGFLRYEKKPIDNFLVAIRLLPEFQNKGIGTKIIKEIIENSDKSITLQVLKINPALSLYKKLGFIVTSENETHFKMIYCKND